AGKIRNRSTVSENMEIATYLLEEIKKTEPELVPKVLPHIQKLITANTSIFRQDVQPDEFNDMGFLVPQQPDPKESQLDMRDLFEWDREADMAQQAAYEQAYEQSIAHSGEGPVISEDEDELNEIIG